MYQSTTTAISTTPVFGLVSDKTNMSLTCHINKLVHMQIQDNYVSIYTSYKLFAINNMVRKIDIHIFSYYWHMPLYKFACHTGIIYLSLHCHICASNKYAPQCHIYPTCTNCSTCINGGSIPIYVPHWYQPYDQKHSTQKTTPPTTQPDCIRWVGHWPNQQKQNFIY